MKSGELLSNTHKIAHDYFSELLGAEKELIAQKKNYVNQKFKMLEEKEEYYRQRKITSTFERLAMIKKYYGEFSPQAIKMETKYINNYGKEDGLTTVEGFGSYQQQTGGFGDNDHHTHGFGDSDHHTDGLGDNDHHSAVFGSYNEEGFLNVD